MGRGKKTYGTYGEGELGKRIAFAMQTKNIENKKKEKKTQETTGAGEDVEKEDHSSTVGGSTRWYNCSGNQSGGSSESWV